MRGQNDELSFEELLDKDSSVTMHQRNLRKLAIEMYKVKHNLSPPPVQELYVEHVNKYEIREAGKYLTSGPLIMGLKLLDIGLQKHGTYQTILKSLNL